jgi:hypothetical protein
MTGELRATFASFEMLVVRRGEPPFWAGPPSQSVTTPPAPVMIGRTHPTSTVKPRRARGSKLDADGSNLQTMT